ncbi:MAG: adenosine deaminase [Clostridiales bacterium]|nr:adenosine deaminase [Clostridiales bacterium]
MEESSFVTALKSESLQALSRISKSDLHSHAGRGGHISFFEKYANVKITPRKEPFESLSEMNQWLKENVKCHLPLGAEGYLKQVEGAFVQAAADSVTVLALSFCVDEIQLLGGMETFKNTIDGLRVKYAPDTALLPDLGLGYFPEEVNELDEILASGWFSGVDIMNGAGTYTMRELKRICGKAKDNGLILKAHIGEFGEAEDVWRYAEELGLDQIQHGVLAAKSEKVMRYLADNKIQCNICPTSNVMLKVAADYKSHPIHTLFANGVKVTINTDDLLIFNSTLSEEYLKLYRAGMKASDLDAIRKAGLEGPANERERF